MPPGVAELLVKIAADTTDLKRGVDNVGASTGKLKGFAIKAGAALGGAFAIDKIAEFGQASVKAARESEVATSRLEQVFSSMGETTGEAAAAAEKYAAALSKQIGVDDESIMAAQAKLATFKEVSSETARQAGIFDRATAAAADLAAAGFGTLDSNAAQLGKALQDPVKGLNALARSGVTFTKAQKDQIKALMASGDQLGAQKIVLGAIEGQVKGTAAATATGADKMSVAFGEMEEQVGAALLPVMDDFANLMTTVLIPAFSASVRFIQQNVTWLAPLTAGILAAAVAVKVLTVAQALFGVTLGISVGWIALIVAGIVALGAGLVMAYQKVGWFHDAVDAVFHFIVRNWPLLISVLTGPIGVAVALIIKNWDKVKAAVSAVIDWIKGHWQLLLTILTGPIGLAVTIIVRNWDRIKSGVIATYNVVKSVFGKIVGAVRAAVGGISSAVGAIVRVFGSIARAAQSAFHTVSSVIGSIAHAISGIVSSAGHMASGIVNAVKGPVNAVIRAWNGLRIPGFTFRQSLPGPLPDISFSWGGVDLPNIPLLARGGLLSKPTLFLGGESTGTEIVSPESMMRRIVREETAGGPLVAQMNVTTWNPQAVAQAIASELAYLEVKRR